MTLSSLDVVPSAVEAYRFGPFTQNLRTRELTRDGVRIHVEPKVFNLIAYLASRRDQVVRHRELLESVWAGETVCLAAVTQCVAQARRTLGDSATQPNYIRTLHRRGYRFIAEVTEITFPATPFRGIDSLSPLLASAG